MADERISSFVTPEGLADLAKVEASLESITQKIVDLNQAGKRAEGLAAQAKSLEDIAKSSNDIAVAQQKMEASTAQLTRTKKQQEAETAKMARALREEAKAADDASNDYKQLSLAYNDAALKAKNYALRLGENHAVTVQAIKDASDMAAVLKRLDAAVGQNQRNVGNYKSAFEGASAATRQLNGSIQQIGRELPAISGGFAIFASAIGNNIAPAADAIKQFREEQKLLKAQGQATQSVFSAIGGAIFSWQTALLVGVTLFTVFAKQIGEFVTGTKQATDELGKFDKQLDSIAKSAATEITNLEKLTTAAQDISASYAERSKAVDELQKQYPEVFGNLNREIILNGDLKDSNDKVTESIFKKAEAQAREAVLKEAIEKKAKAQLELDEAQNRNAGTFLYLSAQRQEQLENQVAQADQIIEGIKKQTEAEQNRTSTIYFLSAAEKKAFEQRERESKRRALMTEAERKEEDRLAKIKPKEDPMIKKLERLRELIAQFSKELRTPDLSNLFKIGKETQDEIDKIQSAAHQRAVDALFPDTKEAEEKAAALNQVLRKHNEDKIRDEKDFQERKKKIIDEANKLASEAQKFGGVAVDIEEAFNARRIAAIDSEIRKINERRDAQILAVESSIQSEDERRIAIASINQQANNEEKELEKERIERQRRAALFQKGILIAQILVETRAAVVKALNDPTIPNFYLRLGNAISAGLFGAAQLTAAIAAPLPQYEEGTKGKPHKGGPAIMFEGNKAEAVYQPGKGWSIGNKEGVYDLAPGSHVVSNKELMNLANMYTLGMPALIPPRGMMDSEGIKQGLKDVQRAIESKPSSDTYWTWQGVLNQARINGNTMTRLHNLQH